MHARVLIGLRGGSSTPAGIHAFKWSVHSAPDLIPLPIIEKGTFYAFARCGQWSMSPYHKIRSLFLSGWLVPARRRVRVR
eukprot:2647102-Pleurochrysis_carterae.AAC.1